MVKRSSASARGSRLVRASLGASVGATLASFVCGAALAQSASGCQQAPVQPQTAGQAQQRLCGAAGAAAEVVQASGNAILQRAGRVTELTGGEALRAGDRILSRAGEARISLGGACVVTLPARQVATIGGGGDGLCLTQRETGPAPGQSGQAATGQTAGGGAVSAAGGFSATPAIAAVGGAIILGGGVIAGTSSSKNSRLSP